MNFSIYKYGEFDSNISLIEFIKDIREEKYINKVDQFRKSKQNDAEIIKEQIPMFTPVGVFDGDTQEKNLKYLSGIVPVQIYWTKPKEYIEWKTGGLRPMCSFINATNNGQIFLFNREVTSTSLLQHHYEAIQWELNTFDDIYVEDFPGAGSKYYLSSDSEIKFNVEILDSGHGPFREYNKCVLKCLERCAIIDDPEKFIKLIVHELSKSSISRDECIMYMKNDFSDIIVIEEIVNAIYGHSFITKIDENINN